MSETYGMEDLLGEFGGRWDIRYKQHAGSYQFRAARRPPDPEGPTLTAPTVVLLRDRIRDHEATSGS